MILSEEPQYYTEIYPISDIPKDVMSTIQEDYDLTGDESPNGELYDEQLLYIRESFPDSYFLASFKEPRIYLGGVVLFLDTKDQTIIDTPNPGFQGIAKSLNGLKESVKLNSLLVPVILDFLKKEGFDRVYVRPLPKQGQILLKYYGFQKEPNDPELLVRHFKLS